MKFFLTILYFVFSLSGFAQFLEPEKVVKLPGIIHETSGLEIINDSVFVTHNDSGDGPNLFFVNQEGELKKTKELVKALCFDWEDITYDGEKFLFIADIGNNMNSRKKLKIHRYNYLDSTFSSTRISYEDQKFPTALANKNFDSEALAYSNGELFIFTKNNTKPYSGICKMYRFSYKKEQEISLQPKDSFLFGNDGYFSHSVTAADFNDDGTKLALLTYKYLYVFYDFPKGKPFQGKYVEFSLATIHQREAVCFDKENNIWMTDEKSKLMNGGKLYKYDLSDFFNTTLLYRKPEMGIVTVKSGEHKLSFKNDQFLNFNLKAEISEEGVYLLDFLEDGVVKSSIEKKYDKTIDESFSFEYADYENKIYSVRIYKDKKLLYANDIKL